MWCFTEVTLPSTDGKVAPCKLSSVNIRKKALADRQALFLLVGGRASFRGRRPHAEFFVDAAHTRHFLKKVDKNFRLKSEE